VITTLGLKVKTAAGTLPRSFGGLNVEIDAIPIVGVIDLIEDVEFEFRAQVATVGHPTLPQVLLRTASGLAWVQWKSHTLSAFHLLNVAEEAEQPLSGEVLHPGGREIRHKEHVALLHRLITIIGSVEADPFL